MARQLLSDILKNNGGNGNGGWWDTTEAAGDFGPVPRGVYICHATKGELESSRTNRTPGYKVEFTILDGDFKGRKLWLDCWFTPAAGPMAKRDLKKLGMKSDADLEAPLPKWLRCKVTAVVRRDDDGIERNKVQTFEVIGIDKPVVDEFAPKPPGDAAEPAGDVDTSFTPPVGF